MDENQLLDQQSREALVRVKFFEMQINEKFTSNLYFPVRTCKLRKPASCAPLTSPRMSSPIIMH